MRPNGVAGSTAPAVTTASAASSSGTLGRLRKNGMRRVLMAKITRVWASAFVPPAAVAAMITAARPHIVMASASHSCWMMRRLSGLTGLNPARTCRVGIACAVPHAVISAALR